MTAGITKDREGQRVVLQDPRHFVTGDLLVDRSPSRLTGDDSTQLATHRLLEAQKHTVRE